MSIITVNKTSGNFSVISNEPLNDKHLSWEARGIIAYLLSKPAGWQCRSYDLEQQTKAGKHIIKRVIKELQDAGYLYRYRASQGRGKIVWKTEIYETPTLNPHFSKGDKSAIENTENTKVDFSMIETYDVVKPVPLVNTDSNNNLSLINTDKDSSAKAEKRIFTKIVSGLKVKDLKALKLTLSDWRQYLEDERSEKNRIGVIDFIEKKIESGPLLPDTEEARLFFDKLRREAEARNRRPPQKFPSLKCKENFDTAAGQLNGTLEHAIDQALGQGILSIPKIVNYISSPKWQKENNHERTRTDATGQNPGGSFSSPQKHNRDPLIGSGQTAEMRAGLQAAFAR